MSDTEAEEMMTGLISPPVDLDRDQETEGRLIEIIRMTPLRSPDHGVVFPMEIIKTTPLSPLWKLCGDNYHECTGGVNIMTRTVIDLAVSRVALYLGVCDRIVKMKELSAKRATVNNMTQKMGDPYLPERRFFSSLLELCTETTASKGYRVVDDEYFQIQRTIKPSKYGCKNFRTFETSRCMYMQDMNSCEQPGNQEVDFLHGKTKIDEVERNLSPTISEKKDKTKYGCKKSPTFETGRRLYVQDMNSCEQPGNQLVDFLHRKTKMDEGERNLSSTISEEEYKQRVEALERLYGKQLYGKSLQEAADCLGVSRSTMKRIRGKHGIPRWRSYKRKVRERFSRKRTHKNELLQGSDGAISCNSQNLYPDSACALLETLPGELPTENTSFTRTNSQTQSAKRQKSQCSGELPSIVEPHLENIASIIDVPPLKLSNGSAIRGESTAFIEITYGERLIRCTLHYPSTLVDLQKKVHKRLNLPLGTFTLKYLDEGGDWVLIACDEDLKLLFLSKGIIRMLVGNTNHL